MSIQNDIGAWSAQSSMKGAYSASINVTNQTRAYLKTLRYTPIRVSLISTAEVLGAAEDDSCYAGNIEWINGLITSVERQEAISEKHVVLNIRSYFARLGNKPINTEAYESTVDLVMTDVRDVYLGIPSGLTSFNPKVNRVIGPISGNNAIDELRRLAQAGESTLFVKETGILVAEQWKDHTSSVDIVISRQAVKSASVISTDNQVPSRIKVRGCFFSQYKAGTRSLSGSKGGGSSGGGGSGNGGGGKITKCFNNGIAAKDIPINMGARWGRDEDALNAEMEVLPALTVDGLKELSFFGDGKWPPGDTKGDLRFPQEGELLPAGEGSVELEMKGAMLPEKEYESPSTMFKPLREEDGRLEKMINGGIGQLIGQAGFAGQSADGPAGGGGSAGGGGNNSGDKTGDEVEDIQIEVTVNDSALQSEFGVTTEQIENVYVPDKETLFDIAIRRFQEIKMERAAWEVELVYLPCITLNSVVTFWTPETQDGGEEEVTGLVTSISISYDTAPIATMKIVVESFEDIGTTEYTSTNLLQDPNMFGESSSTGWSSTGLAKTENGLGLINAYDPDVGSSGKIILTQGAITAGGDYEFSFDYDNPQGTQDLLFEIKAGGGGTLHTENIADGTTGSKVVSVTPSDDELIFEFSSTSIAGVRTLWILSSPKLTKTVTA